jgi:hypothetical protein
LPVAWHAVLQQWLQGPAFRLDRSSLRASLVVPEAVRGEAQSYGRALQVWPQLWSFCRERFA